MTPSLDQAMLKAQMETLAKVYVSLQFFAMDSLTATADKDDHWRTVCDLSLNASDNIRQAVDRLVNVYHLLRSIT